MFGELHKKEEGSNSLSSLNLKIYSIIFLREYSFMHQHCSVDLDPRTRYTLWGATIGGFFQWLVIYVGNQSNIQRALACPSLRNAQMFVVTSSYKKAHIF